jgi:hypothetical protein
MVRRHGRAPSGPATARADGPTFRGRARV